MVQRSVQSPCAQILSYRLAHSYDDVSHNQFLCELLSPRLSGRVTKMLHAIEVMQNRFHVSWGKVQTSRNHMDETIDTLCGLLIKTRLQPFFDFRINHITLGPFKGFEHAISFIVLD